MNFTSVVGIALSVLLIIILLIVPSVNRNRSVYIPMLTDTKTGLMWSAKDNGNHINWIDARSYCQSYSGGDHTDWRMPTLAELTSLYDPGIKNKHGYHIPKLIDTTAESCWASETRGGKAARFNFTYGQEYWLRKTHSGVGTVLPVRSGN